MVRHREACATSPREFPAFSRAGCHPVVKTWHVITGEYPPQPGGVSDYTRQLARGLVEAGDSVEIWAPPYEREQEGREGRERIIIHRLPDRFGVRSLLHLTRALDRFPAPRRILV